MGSLGVVAGLREGKGDGSLAVQSPMKPAKTRKHNWRVGRGRRVNQRSHHTRCRQMPPGRALCPAPAATTPPPSPRPGCRPADRDWHAAQHLTAQAAGLAGSLGRVFTSMQSSQRSHSMCASKALSSRQHVGKHRGQAWAAASGVLGSRNHPLVWPGLAQAPARIERPRKAPSHVPPPR